MKGLLLVMRKLTLMAGALVAIVLLVGVAQAAPRLVIPVSDFSFGYVPQHSKISHTFWLHSSGDDDLKILKVLPG